MQEKTRETKEAVKLMSIDTNIQKKYQQIKPRYK